jgi:hypothetical protein
VCIRAFTIATLIRLTIHGNAAKGVEGAVGQLASRRPAGVSGLCLDPHDLAIAKYVARRDKDVVFNRALANRGVVKKHVLLGLLAKTPIGEVSRERIRSFIENDFVN